VSSPMTQSNSSSSSRQYRHHSVSGASAEPAILMMITKKKLVLHRRHSHYDATSGNRTPPNCLEGNYANHYTNAAVQRNSGCKVKDTRPSKTRLYNNIENLSGMHGLFVCLASACYSAHGRFNSNLLQLAYTTLTTIPEHNDAGFGLCLSMQIHLFSESHPWGY